MRTLLDEDSILDEDSTRRGRGLYSTRSLLDEDGNSTLLDGDSTPLDGDSTLYTQLYSTATGTPLYSTGTPLHSTGTPLYTRLHSTGRGLDGDSSRLHI